ncbi:exonuclease domain-containing protein [Sphingomonas sanxanigenens]|uniref:exonuclease domain-containing protein n=1 Tax=Sphingomonas sanxanigenens TaxID=397260 RepID=UPI00063D38C0|nr:exonuclease domain-containing protein [Sphingomonas sanxanigenens]
MRAKPLSAPGAHVAAAGTMPDFVVVDVETACQRVSSICQIGIVGFKDGAEIFEYETFVDPLDDFSSFNTRIHGITCDHVAGKPSFAVLHATIDGHLSGRVTVAHSYFDKGALGAACHLHGRAPIETRWLDSVRVAKRAWPELQSHRLNVLTKFLGIRHRHHDALSDARAAGMVILRAIEHTGIDLAGWLAPATSRGAAVPKPASIGPLKGERIALLGAPRDGALACSLAAAGARIMAAVGTTTTMLVIGDDQPFGRYVTAHEDHRRAEDMRRRGVPIAITTEADIRARIALPIAS